MMEWYMLAWLSTVVAFGRVLFFKEIVRRNKKWLDIRYGESDSNAWPAEAYVLLSILFFAFATIVAIAFMG